MATQSARRTGLVLFLALVTSQGFGGSFVLDVPSPGWPLASDILRDEPGPVSALPRGGVSAANLGLQPPDVIDALSDGRDPVDRERHPGMMRLIFSVSRDTTGLPGTAVRQERLADTVPPAGAVPFGHASDLFVWNGMSGINALAPAPLGWSLGSQTGDEANAHLRVGAAGQPGDNVTAYDRATMGFQPQPGGPAFPPQPIFFSLANGSPTLAMLGATGGDVLAVGGAFGPVPVVFIPHGSLGLPPWVDLDALDLEVRRNPAGALAPWRVRFSVSGATLGFAAAGGQVVNSGAHVLLSPANGGCAIEIPAADLGLRLEDDVDALESVVTWKCVGAGLEPEDEWILESHGSALVIPAPEGDKLDVTDVGSSGEDGVELQFPPSTSVGLRGTSERDGKLRFQARTPGDDPGLHLLPYLEQDNVLRKLTFGLDKQIGQLGVADVEARLTAWRDSEEVGELQLDSLSELGEMESLRLQLDLNRPNGIIAILIGLLSSTPGTLEAVIDVHTDGKSLVIMPDPGVVADHVRVHLRYRHDASRHGALHWLNGLKVSASELGAFSLDAFKLRRGLLFRGVAHTALGGASIGEVVNSGEGDEALEVARLGESGEDGVQVDLPAGLTQVASITPDQKTIIGGFLARVGVELEGSSGERQRKEIQIRSAEGGLEVSLLSEEGAGAGGGEGGSGGGLLSSPIGTFATHAVPSRLRLSRSGLQLLWEESLSFFAAGSGEETRGLAHNLDGVLAPGEQVRLMDVRAAGISAFQLTLADDLEGPHFRRGDADGSAVVEITDAVATLNYLFLGEAQLRCLDAADANDDGEVSLSDAIATLGALFLGTTELPAPGLETCGVDPTVDTLGCEAEGNCP